MEYPVYLIVILLLSSISWGTPSNVLYLPAGRAGEMTLEQHRAQMLARDRALDNLRAVLRRVRHTRSGIPGLVLPSFDTLIIPVLGSTLQLFPRPGPNKLTFAYSGWTADEEQALKTFLGDNTQGAYRVLVSLYGPPASDCTVTLEKGTAQSGIEGGELVYDPDSGNITLRLEPPPDLTVGSGVSYERVFYLSNLLHLILHCFHAPAFIRLDAWEEGMARAVAIVAIMQLEPDYDPNLDATYLLPLYDILNQPGLSSSELAPLNGMPHMAVWRVGMATSAWLKIYAENPKATVFKDFNDAYYTAYAGNSSISENADALKGLLAQVVPSVEGQPLATWFDHQYVLKPVDTVGTHLYVYALPLQENLPLMIYYYSVSLSAGTDGGTEVTETPLTGTARLDFTSYDGLPLYPEEGYDPSTDYHKVDIPTSTDPGVGYLNPSFYNIGDPPTQRIRVATTIAGLKVLTYYPYYTRGDDASQNLIFGLCTDADTGSLNVYMPGVPLPSTQLTQGAYYCTVPSVTGSLTSFSQILLVYASTDNTTTVTVKRNIGPGYYIPIIATGGTPASTRLNATFLSGLSLISFPMTPDEKDAAKVFGFAADDPTFLFAGWDPTSPGDNKYRTYPAVGAITVGNGYWVKLSSPDTISITGTPLAADDPHAITLSPGWNLIGNTFNGALNPWNITVEKNGAVYSLLDAIKQKLVTPIWEYNPQTAACEIDPSLERWAGAWICDRDTGTLTLYEQDALMTRSRSASSSSTDPVRLLTDGGWGIGLQAHAGAVADTFAVAGVSTRAVGSVNALDWRKPPAMGSGVRLAFILPADRAAGAAYASDIRAAVSPGGEAWEFELSSTQANPITLTWPDLRSVPARYQPVLEDTFTGTRRYLRTTASYTFSAAGAPDQPSTRRFRLLLEQRTAVTPPTMQVSGLPGKFPAAAINFTFSADADALLQVRAMSGKLIRTIRIPSTRANEPTSLTWDGKSDTGALAPAGTYLILLTTTTPDGQVFRTSRFVQVGN